MCVGVFFTHTLFLLFSLLMCPIFGTVSVPLLVPAGAKIGTGSVPESVLVWANIGTGEVPLLVPVGVLKNVQVEQMELDFTG